jgi:hypothetical protein
LSCYFPVSLEVLDTFTDRTGLSHCPTAAVACIRAALSRTSIVIDQQQAELSSTTQHPVSSGPFVSGSIQGDGTPLGFVRPFKLVKQPIRKIGCCAMANAVSLEAGHFRRHHPVGDRRGD